MKRLGWITLIVLASLVGLLLLGNGALLLAKATAPYWGAENLPPEGTAEGNIARLVWNDPPSLAWTQPPTDVSNAVCPLVDDALRSSILSSGGYWKLELGTCFWTERRPLKVILNEEPRTCSAIVLEPVPESSL